MSPDGVGHGIHLPVPLAHGFDGVRVVPYLPLFHPAELAGKKGYTISNCDCTLICEYPKIGPHALEMASVLARIMRLNPDRVSVKATTSEGLGFTGRQEGIAAMATVTLVRA